MFGIKRRATVAALLSLFGATLQPGCGGGGNQTGTVIDAPDWERQNELDIAADRAQRERGAQPGHTP
jgi:hypothetical protein